MIYVVHTYRRPTCGWDSWLNPFLNRDLNWTHFHLQETAELQKKQQWYQQNQVNMQKEDEEEYLEYCSEAMFRIHILELRLNR